MKIKDILYQTPEMTEEKLLQIINDNIPLLRNYWLVKRIQDLHKDIPINEALLKEYDLVQDKKSYLSKSQRDIVVGFVGMCMIQMTKGNGGNEDSRDSNGDSPSSN